MRLREGHNRNRRYSREGTVGAHRAVALDAHRADLTEDPSVHFAAIVSLLLSRADNTEVLRSCHSSERQNR